MEKLTKADLQASWKDISDSLKNTAPQNSRPVTPEKVRSICAVINKIRLAQGWHVLAPDDAELMALTWIEILDQHQIPWTAYEFCYKRMMKDRAELKARGQDVQNITANDLVVAWLGPDGIGAQMHEKRLALPRPDCERCRNTGWVPVKRDVYGGVYRCDCGR